MPRDTMNRDEARAALRGWKEVEDVIAAELAALTPEAKLRQLESLMQAARLFAWPATEEEDGEVRGVWMRLHAMQRW
jgi:Ser/Thr protein kinase RdoA (MazF antagonist)